jgi:tRNA threonylcarbamoyl adenosine modification protein YeaZ
MAILVIDSTNELLVGILDDLGENTLALKYHAETREHVEKLAVITDELLRSASLHPKDITEVIVSAGPGLYTGLRAGMAFAKSFAFAVGAKVTGVVTLDVMAFAVRDVKTTILAITDAKRHEVFYALYGENGCLLIPHSVARMENVAETVKNAINLRKLKVVSNLKSEDLLKLRDILDCTFMPNPLQSDAILPCYYAVSREYPNCDAPLYLRQPDVFVQK